MQNTIPTPAITELPKLEDPASILKQDFSSDARFLLDISEYLTCYINDLQVTLTIEDEIPDSVSAYVCKIAGSMISLKRGLDELFEKLK
jgi:hypothetical protein